MSTKSKGPVINAGVCRCCGAIKKCRLLNAEYEGLGRREVYYEMIIESFGLLLSNLDGEINDRLICATCVTRLREATVFRQQVLECEEKLLKAKFEDKKPPEKEDEEKQLQIEGPKEIKMDIDDEDHDYKFGHYVSSSESDEPIQRKTNCMQTKISKTIQENNLGKNRITSYEKLTSKEMCINEKALLNLGTIVQNSYVCPFSSFFNNYYCIYCRQKFIDCEKLREHTLTHNSKTYKEIIKDIVQRSNKKCEIDINRIDFRLCDEKIDNLESFKQHITSVHKRIIRPTNDDFLVFNLTQSNLKCIECNTNFEFFHDLKKHMAEHFGSYTCEVCGVHFFEEIRLLTHKKSHQPSKVKLHPCKQCGKTFKNKYPLSIHIARVHSKEAIYLCQKCDENFFSNSLRHRHMVEIHGEESSIFKCENCNKVYINRKTLRDHKRRVHLKLLKHECKICEKKFYLPSRLKEHVYIHTGERNFRCEHCGKSYPRLRALKVHMESHSSYKKYKCTMCAASFSQNVSLKNHIKRLHQNPE